MMVWSHHSVCPVWNPNQNTPIPFKPDNRMYPVIFELKKGILLSRSTYKVARYIDFVPHDGPFVKYYNYLKRFQADMDDPRHVGVLSLYNAQTNPHTKRFVHSRANELFVPMTTLGIHYNNPPTS